MNRAKTMRAGRATAVLTPAVAVLLGACADEATMTLLPDLEVAADMTAFAATDPLIGTDETIRIEARNDGDAPVLLSEVLLEGTDAVDFFLTGAEPSSLGPGESMTFEIGFRPVAEGDKSATLVVLSDDPATPRREIRVTGRAARFQYTQVDRKGIPALNTVFNHPSGTAGFDKTAYNRASPATDVTAYRNQFITVLGAVGNGDPEATADLLLPDELPVSLGGTTSFATLTGRALADDATDIALFVTIGDASLHSDNVDANDVPFRATFPNVAPPHN